VDFINILQKDLLGAQPENREMTMHLKLPSVEMTPEAMQDLEDRGMILRLAPGRFSPEIHDDEPPPNEVYQSDERYGPHKLIACSLNTTEAVKNFVYHPDREEFLFIGNPESKPSYLVVSLLYKDEFEHMVRTQQLGSEHLVALRMKFNDPLVSFFTMNAYVPHGEVTVHGAGLPATYFVTESRDIKGEKIELGGYSWEVTGS
jgi:hypothetical protein